MAHVEEKTTLELEEPVMVEGLPGVGLVGKIAADHLVDAFDMTYYAACRCDGLPDVAVYGEGERGVKPPVRIYADERRDLLVLQSDVPVSPAAATEFAGCIAGWLADNEVFPIYASGLPEDKEEVPALYGVGPPRRRDRRDERRDRQPADRLRDPDRHTVAPPSSVCSEPPYRSVR